jgi:hypothetical protein
MGIIYWWLKCTITSQKIYILTVSTYILVIDALLKVIRYQTKYKTKNLKPAHIINTWDRVFFLLWMVFRSVYAGVAGIYRPEDHISLTPWSTGLIQELITAKPVKKSHSSDGSHMFFTAFTTARHLFLSRARPVDPQPPVLLHYSGLFWHQNTYWMLQTVLL